MSKHLLQQMSKKVVFFPLEIALKLRSFSEISEKIDILQKEIRSSGKRVRSKLKEIKKKNEESEETGSWKDRCMKSQHYSKSVQFMSVMKTFQKTLNADAVKTSSHLDRTKGKAADISYCY